MLQFTGEIVTLFALANVAGAQTIVELDGRSASVKREIRGKYRKFHSQRSKIACFSSFYDTCTEMARCSENPWRDFASPHQSSSRRQGADGDHYCEGRRATREAIPFALFRPRSVFFDSLTLHRIMRSMNPSGHAIVAGRALSEVCEAPPPPPCCSGQKRIDSL